MARTQFVSGIAPLASVLVVAPAYPWPLTDGGRIGLGYRLRALSRAGVDVRLLCTPHATDAVGDSPVESWCSSVHVVRRPAWWTAAWRHPFEPYQASSRVTPLVREALREELRRRPADIVHLEHSYMAGAREAVPAATPVVLGIHNIEAEALRARAASIGRSIRSLAYEAEAWRMARFESRVFASAQMNGWIFVSDEERRRMEQRVPRLAGRCFTLPPGTDLPSRMTTVGSHFVFVGSLWYDPNVEGLRWFVREVWPLVRARLPDAVLVVAGRKPSAELANELRQVPGVDFRGEVPDVDPIYAEARVIVLPVRLGAGVKVKTIEALGRGLPCVGTAHAFEGIGIEAERVALVADQPSAFAQHCVEAHAGMEPAPSRASAGAAYVREHCSWDAIGRRYVEILQAVRSAG